MKAGLTLLELIVVILIIGIMGTFGFAQYARMAEKARGVEAKTVLMTMRKLAQAYYMEYGPGMAAALGCTNREHAAILGIGDADDQLPWAASSISSCRSSHYFSYTCSAGWRMENGIGTVTTYYLFATRCGPGAGGKEPAGDPFGRLELKMDLTTGACEWTRVIGEGLFNFSYY